MTWVRAVVFDWAGTAVDYGSSAPALAFVDAFAALGVAITAAEARAPMGLPKRAHIEAVARAPRVAAALRATLGRDAVESDLDALYAAYTPRNRETAARRAAPIAGVVEVVEGLRRRGVRVGSTTGYPREIMDAVRPLAAAAGFCPDNVVCASDVPEGRPSPMMMYRCFLDLGVWPADRVVKVDDTAPGIAEGLAAGAWCVGVSLSGNEVGLTEEELEALDPDERARRNVLARTRLFAAGAHEVIDTVASLPEALARIEVRRAWGASGMSSAAPIAT